MADAPEAELHWRCIPKQLQQQKQPCFSLLAQFYSQLCSALHRAQLATFGQTISPLTPTHKHTNTVDNWPHSPLPLCSTNSLLPRPSSARLGYVRGAVRYARQLNDPGHKYQKRKLTKTRSVLKSNAIYSHCCVASSTIYLYGWVASKQNRKKEFWARYRIHSKRKK